MADEPIPASQAKMICLIAEKSTWSVTILLTESCPLLTALSVATPTLAFSKAESSIIDLSRFKMKAATRKETIAATAIPAQTQRTFAKPPADLPDAIP